MRRSKSFSGQKGFTALEMIVVLIVSVAALSFGARYMSDYADNQVNQVAADHMKTVADAAAKYTKDNYAAIMAIATNTTPAVITISMLKNTGYLTSSVTDLNAFGQNYQILVLQPVAGKLETLVVTTGGETIPEMSIRRIAQLSGARGGFISTTNAAVAVGSLGGWQMPLAAYGTSPGAGHLATALFFDDGALVSDYLYRSAVAGHPEFNRMNTAIDMAGNNINNGGQVNTATLVTTGNATVGGSASVAGNETIGGNSTVTGTVTAAKVSVPAGNNLQVGGSAFYGDGANSAVRQNGGFYIQHYDGSAADIPQVGNVNSSGTVTGQMFVPTNAYTANTFCWWPNAIATEAGTGRMLSCQTNGSAYAWRRPGSIATTFVGAVTGNAPRDVGWHKFCVLNGIGDPQVTGTTIILVPTAGPNAEGYWWWQVQMNAYNGAGTAVVACFDDV